MNQTWEQVSSLIECRSVVSHPLLRKGWGTRVSFSGWKSAQLGDSPFWADDPGQAQGVPVAIIEGLPGFAVVVADVGPVGSGGNPGLGVPVPGYGGAVAVRRLLGCGPVLASVYGPGGGAG